MRNPFVRARNALRILKGTGPSEFVIAARDALRSKKLSRQSVQKFDRSSISDAGLYPAFCLLASSDDQVFKRFRRSLIYRVILEHVNTDQGREYLREIEEDGGLLDQFRAQLELDTLGGPIKYRYGNYGLISPTTLRYIKVASDLNNLFGSLTGKTIAEIGVGYGGQCRVISTIWPVKSYVLFDIPEVLALSHRYLEESNIDCSILIERDGRNPQSDDIDLLISNYAFSELRREMQEQYFDTVLRHAPRGYITYNHVAPPEFRSMNAYEFAERFPGSQILPEKPMTHEKNVIVVWGTDNPSETSPNVAKRVTR